MVYKRNLGIILYVIFLATTYVTAALDQPEILNCHCGAKFMSAPSADKNRDHLCVCHYLHDNIKPNWSGSTDKMILNTYCIQKTYTQAMNSLFIKAVLSNEIYVVAMLLAHDNCITPRSISKIPNSQDPILTLQQAFFHASVRGYSDIVRLLFEIEYFRLSCLTPWLIDLTIDQATIGEHNEVCAIIKAHSTSSNISITHSSL